MGDTVHTPLVVKNTADATHIQVQPGNPQAFRVLSVFRATPHIERLTMRMLLAGAAWHLVATKRRSLPDARWGKHWSQTTLHSRNLSVLGPPPAQSGVAVREDPSRRTQAHSSQHDSRGRIKRGRSTVPTTTIDHHHTSHHHHATITPPDSCNRSDQRDLKP